MSGNPDSSTNKKTKTLRKLTKNDKSYIKK